MIRRHLTDVAKVFGARVYILIAGTALTIILARWLSTEDFGRYQLIMATASLIPIVLDFGISHSLPRFLAGYRDRHPDQVLPALKKGIQLKLVALVVGVVLLILLRHHLERFLGLETVHPWLGLGLVILVGLSIQEFLMKAFEGTQHFNGVLVLNVLKSTTDLGVTAVLVGTGYALGGALNGKIAGIALGVAAASWWVWKQVVPNLPPAGKAMTGLGRKIFSYGSWLIVVDIAGRVAINVDRVLINILISTQGVALYSVPARILMMSQIVGLSVSSVIGPATSRTERRREVLEPTLRLLGGLYVLMGVLVWFWADPVVPAIFGSAYRESVRPMQIMALAMPFMGISPVISLALNYTGAARSRAWMILIAVTLTVAGHLVLIPKWGIQGSALALLSGQVVYVLLQGTYCVRHLALDGKSLAIGFIKTGLLGAAAAGILFLVQDASLWMSIPASLLAAGLYLLALSKWKIIPGGFVRLLTRGSKS